MTPLCPVAETATAAQRSKHNPATTAGRQPGPRSAESQRGPAANRRLSTLASMRQSAGVLPRSRVTAPLSGCASARPRDCAVARTSTRSTTQLLHRAAAQVRSDPPAPPSTCADAHLLTREWSR
jgi:hypothetical protein